MYINEACFQGFRKSNTIYESYLTIEMRKQRLDLEIVLSERVELVWLRLIHDEQDHESDDEADDDES